MSQVLGAFLGYSLLTGRLQESFSKPPHSPDSRSGLQQPPASLHCEALHQQQFGSALSTASLLTGTRDSTCVKNLAFIWILFPSRIRTGCEKRGKKDKELAERPFVTGDLGKRVSAPSVPERQEEPDSTEVGSSCGWFCIHFMVKRTFCSSQVLF